MSAREPRGFWRRLVWRYDGKPDLTRDDERSVPVVGWGPFRLPGERARVQRHVDEARNLFHVNEEAP